MLAVDQRLLAGGAGRLNASLDCLEILLIADAERHPHMEVRGLGDEADGIG